MTASPTASTLLFPRCPTNVPNEISSEIASYLPLPDQIAFGQPSHKHQNFIEDILTRQWSLASFDEGLKLVKGSLNVQLDVLKAFTQRAHSWEPIDKLISSLSLNQQAVL